MFISSFIIYYILAFRFRGTQFVIIVNINTPQINKLFAKLRISLNVKSTQCLKCFVQLIVAVFFFRGFTVLLEMHYVYAEPLCRNSSSFEDSRRHLLSSVPLCFFFSSYFSIFGKMFFTFFFFIHLVFRHCLLFFIPGFCSIG